MADAGVPGTGCREATSSEATIGITIGRIRASAAMRAKVAITVCRRLSISPPSRMSSVVQREGEPIKRIGAGDVVWFLPGEKHWHGAPPTTAMSHVAVQEREGGTAAA